MKQTKTLAILIIIGYILAAGCVTPNAYPEGNQTPLPLPNQSSKEMQKGQLIVSIGDYNGRLPVLLDNTFVGEVIPGEPLNISVNTGSHMVKLCDGDICEEAEVKITYAITTTLDFSERLKMDVPKGFLIVSIGNYIAKLPVFLDNTQIGEVLPDEPLNISANEGYHVVKVCDGNICSEQRVQITAEEENIVDFEELLKKEVPQGQLIVSIGGYNAILPVFIDNKSIGNISPSMPLKLMVSEGHHEIRVCIGMICEYEDVEILFGKQSIVDFEKRLRKDVAFPSPTVRIINYYLNDNVLTANIEFINPDTSDLFMATTIGCGYSYIDWTSWARKNEFAQTQVNQVVKAGGVSTQQGVLYLSKGHHIIASEPTIVNVTIEKS